MHQFRWLTSICITPFAMAHEILKEGFSSCSTKCQLFERKCAVTRRYFSLRKLSSCEKNDPITFWRRIAFSGLFFCTRWQCCWVFIVASFSFIQEHKQNGEHPLQQRFFMVYHSFFAEICTVKSDSKITVLLKEPTLSYLTLLAIKNPYCKCKWLL